MQRELAVPAGAAARLKKHLRHLPALLGVGLLIGAIYVVQKEFRGLHIDDIAAALKAIPVQALAFSFVWTFFSYFVLTFYDRLGTIYAGHKVSYGKVALPSAPMRCRTIWASPPCPERRCATGSMPIGA
jgi:uncharacterized membrane protein YbhN (UPF0104 family)